MCIAGCLDTTVKASNHLAKVVVWLVACLLPSEGKSYKNCTALYLSLHMLRDRLKPVQIQSEIRRGQKRVDDSNDHGDKCAIGSNSAAPGS